MALIALYFFRPTDTQIGEPPAKLLRGLIATTAAAAAIFLIAGAVWYATSENPTDSLARLRGESLRIIPAVVDLGDGRLGEKRQVTVSLRNLTSHPIHVMGGGVSSCACNVTDDLPILMPPKESRAIRIRYEFGGRRALFQEQFIFYTDDETQAEVVGQLRGRVVAAK